MSRTLLSRHTRSLLSILTAKRESTGRVLAVYVSVRKSGTRIGMSTNVSAPGSVYRTYTTISTKGNSVTARGPNVSQEDKAQQALRELKQATREAHECLQEIHATERRINDKLDGFRGDLALIVRIQIDDTVKEGLERYKDVIDEAIKQATQATYDRFDLLASIMMGDDKQSQRQGRKPIDELIRIYQREHGSPAVAIPERRAMDQSRPAPTD